MSSIRQVQSRAQTPDEKQDVSFLFQLFATPRFQQALDIHNTVLRVAMKSDPGMAVNDCALDICQEVILTMGTPLTMGQHIEELRRLLQQHHIQVGPTAYIFINATSKGI